MRNRVSVPALVQFDPFDNGVDPVAFRQRISHGLDNEDAAALGTTVAVGGGVKGFALAGGAEEMRSVETKIHLRKVSL